MSDLFKKFQEQVALQTRKDIGQVNAIPIHGIKVSDATENEISNIGPVRWDYFEYSFTRNDKDFIPTLEGNNSFFNTIVVNSNSIIHDFTPWGSGSFYSNGNKNSSEGLHRAWGIRLTAKNSSISVPAIMVSGGKVNFAVWVRVYDKRGWQYKKIFEHLSKNGNFLGSTKFPISQAINSSNISGDVVVPQSSIPGTELWITSYSHKSDDVFAGNEASQERIFALNIGLKDHIADWTNLGSFSPKPQWYTPTDAAILPLTTSIDTKTRNVINNVNIAIPPIPNWSSINVYRASSLAISSVQAISTDGRSILVSSSEPAAYPSNVLARGTFLEEGDDFEDQEMTIDGVTINCRNEFNHGGERISQDWGSLTNNGATPANYGKLYDSPFEPKFESDCFQFDFAKSTNTAKSFFADSDDTFTLSDFDVSYEDSRRGLITTPIFGFTFWSKLLSSTADTAYAEARFQCGAAPAATDIIYKINLPTSNSWEKITKIYEVGDRRIPESNFVDAGYQYVKLRLYGASAQFAGTRRQYDGFKLCKWNINDQGGYDGSSINNGVVVTFQDTFELPRFSRTTFNSTFTTAESFDGQYPVTTRQGGTIILSDSAYYKQKLKFSKYGKGMQFTSSYRNLIESGDFNGPIHWTVTDGNPVLSSFATSGAMFGPNVGKFYSSVSTNRSTYQYSKYLPGIYGTGAVTGDSAFAFSIWAKGREKGTKFWMSVKDNGTPVEESAKYFTLSTSWARYSISHQFTDDAARGSNLILSVSLPSTNTYPSEIYLDGAQADSPRVTNSIYSMPFNTLDTTDAGVISTANNIDIHSCHSIINKDNGTIRLWYSPELAYDSAKSTDSGDISRVLFNQSSAFSYVKLEYKHNNTINPQFSFSNWDGASSISESTVSGILFKSHEPIHITCHWHGSSAWMYVNTAKSNASEYYNAGTSQSMKIGADSDSGTNFANGVITNFRVDTAVWSHDYVKTDYYGKRLQLTSANVLLPRTEYEYVGSVQRRSAETQNPIVFKDDQGLNSETHYNYAFSYVDTLGKESPLSSTKPIVTTVMPDFVVSSDSAASRIMVGQEKNDNAFLEMRSQGIRYHAPGTETSAGFSVAKQVESGVATYGDTVTYSNRFTNWDGQEMAPHLIHTPKNIRTFDHADFIANAADQSLEFIVTQTTAGGHVVDGYLYSGFAAGASVYQLGDYWTYDTYDGGWVNTGEHADISGNVIVQGWTLTNNSNISTVLPTTTSKYPAIGFKFRGRVDYNFPTSAETLSIRCYSNVNVSTSFNDDMTNWTLVEEKNVTLNSSTSISSMNFYGASLDGARSVAFELSTPGPLIGPIGGVGRFSYLEPIELWVITTNPTAIVSGADLGTYSWLALDGGLIG